ncbi:hypothetical protein [Paenibacillus sp. GYB003]|uniref:hypothetical protein n=1 Tax=Paenibacillus sp. GYB003 TaxID=2994392 RepID=UPI002F96B130
MGSSNNFLKVMFNTVLKETDGFSEKFANAARGGANVAGKQIIEAVSDLNQPSDVLIGKVVTALKGGLFAAGQEILNAGVDMVKGVSSPEDESKSSKSSKKKKKK